jgi:hypothetical protein
MIVKDGIFFFQGCRETFEGTTIESKGPSSFHFQDCGGFVGTRFRF